MKLSNLIETAAAELGVKSTEVNTRARFLREGGTLRSGGRGKGAPEMQADDLSTLMLGMVSHAEPTAAMQGHVEMCRARLVGCEWVDLSAAAEYVASDGPKRFKWYVAPLSPMFGEADSAPNVHAGLSKVIQAAANPAIPVQFRGLRCMAGGNGMTIEIEHDEMASHPEMAARLIAETGDRSDGMYFSDNERPVQWIITTKYQISEPQRDRREHVLAIPGEIGSRLIRQAIEEGGK